MPRDVPIDEIEAAMAAAIDGDGNDVRLADTVAQMTPEQRRQSDENIRAWAASVRAGLRSRRDADDI